MKTLYYGGDILTMEQPLYAEAILVEDGIIRALGKKEDLAAIAGADTVRFHLNGHTLLPAFLDPHSHITSFSNTLSLAHLDGVQSFDELGSRLLSFQKERKIPAGAWITAFGYDNNFLTEGRHPDKSVLDHILPDYPVLVTHASGHMGVLNSAALAALGIDSNTPDPEGGLIGRVPGTREPNGYLEETAFTLLASKLPQPSMEQLCSLMESAQDIYLSHGITTVQDGLTKQGEWAVLKEMAEKKRLRCDIVCFVDLRDNKAIAEQNRQYVKQYRNRLKIGGYKIFLDGSPQGRTAWMTKPYLGDGPAYKGYPIYPEDTVTSFLEEGLRDQMQVLAHCNGDAAAQQFLDAYRTAREAVPSAPDIRPVMIHAQLLRRDQLPELRRLHMTASFFVAHTYYWGDVHRKNFGAERADFISPVKSAIREGVNYTFHQDTPVLPPDMLDTIWCAVNRITKEGSVLGPDECVTPLEALRAVTVNAAYQYFEEDRKGSLAPGKLADLVILDRNPLKADPLSLRDIRVLETIKEGNVLYRNEK